MSDSNRVEVQELNAAVTEANQFKHVPMKSKKRYFTSEKCDAIDAIRQGVRLAAFFVIRICEMDDGWNSLPWTIYLPKVLR